MGVCYAIPNGDEIDNIITDKSAYKHIIMLNQVVYLQKIDGSAMSDVLLESLGYETDNSVYYRIRIEFTNGEHHTFSYTTETIRDKIFTELIDALNKYHSR